MSNRTLSGFFGGICGVSGYGVVTCTVHMTNDEIKFIVAMATAFIAGAVGYGGQLALKWIIKKIYRK
jgi:CDP-diglyceride synthetase